MESLRSNLHLRELYLTGNPCTEYQGYRAFVVATLPQLVVLDGKEIAKSERISAIQQLDGVRNHIAEQQQQHTLRREKERVEFREKYPEKETTDQKKGPGFDGRWYTDPNAHVSKEKVEEEVEPGDEEVVPGDEDEEVPEEEEEEEAYTPEYRIKSYKDMAKKKTEQDKKPRSVSLARIPSSLGLHQSYCIRKGLVTNGMQLWLAH